MPAMGDSVAEGTVLEWRKQEGDEVSAEETIVEISTDKVDAEVPAPTSGKLVKIHAAEGDTVAGNKLQRLLISHEYIIFAEQETAGASPWLIVESETSAGLAVVAASLRYSRQFFTSVLGEVLMHPAAARRS